MYNVVDIWEGVRSPGTSMSLDLTHIRTPKNQQQVMSTGLEWGR
jgi:hypothetical protein